MHTSIHIVRKPFYVRGWHELALAVFMLSLVAINFGWAQGDQPECEFCYSPRDYTCNGATNCESTAFTPQCDMNADFWCQIACSNGVEPSHCRVTAEIRQAGSAVPLATCENGDEQGCWGSQSAGSVYLYANVQYTISVCLQSCAGSDCCGNCRAVAFVKTKNATCPAP